MIDIYVSDFVVVVLVVLCGIVVSLVLSIVFSILLWMDGTWGWYWSNLCYSVGHPVTKLLLWVERKIDYE